VWEDHHSPVSALSFVLPGAAEDSALSFPPGWVPHVCVGVAGALHGLNKMGEALPLFSFACREANETRRTLVRLVRLVRTFLHKKPRWLPTQGPPAPYPRPSVTRARGCNLIN
jgi:hypothetical protein